MIPEGYISGQSRDHDDDHKVTHLYKGNFADPGWPMCARGWNRDDGESYSIWRNNVSDAGICTTCFKRALAGKEPIPYKGYKKYIPVNVEGKEYRISRKKVIIDTDEKFHANYAGYEIICSIDERDLNRRKPYYAWCMHPSGGYVVDGWVGETMKEAIEVCMKNIHL